MERADHRFCRKLRFGMKGIYFLILLLFFGLYACKPEPNKPQSVSGVKWNDTLIFSAVPAPEWTGLMQRTSGWFGADGIFSIPLNGNETQMQKDRKTLFIFSDTYIGEVENGVPLPGNVMVNNSIARLSGNEAIEDSISFEYNRDTNQKPSSYFVPDNALSNEKHFFWLGDGFVNKEKGDALYIFAYHVHKTGPNVFDFEQSDVILLKIKDVSNEGITEYEQLPTGLGKKDAEDAWVYFGSAIYVNTEWAGAPDPDGFVYIYGIREAKKSLIAARVPPSRIENFEDWTFWDGSSWQKNSQNAISLADGVSNELSISPTGDGRYLLTFTVLGISEKIGIRVGESPIGPFGPINEVYTCPEYAEKGLFPYNAKAHYHLSKPGKLLVSYNTITLNFWEDIQKDATIYHPRFIWVNYK